MHGELAKMKCSRTGTKYAVEGDLVGKDRCQCCDQEGTLRPDIVWFGEMPYYMDRILELLDTCDLFISIGTSGQVYPAAGFVQGLRRGVPKIEINTMDTAISHDFDNHWRGPASEQVTAFVDDLLSKV